MWQNVRRIAAGLGRVLQPTKHSPICRKAYSISVRCESQPCLDLHLKSFMDMLFRKENGCLRIEFQAPTLLCAPRWINKSPIRSSSYYIERCRGYDRSLPEFLSVPYFALFIPTNADPTSPRFSILKQYIAHGCRPAN